MTTLTGSQLRTSRSLASLLLHGLTAGVVIFLAALALGSPVIVS